MISLNEYRLNPCGTLSIPYWKNKTLHLPENIKIVHHRDFDEGDLEDYRDELYFRLYHSLKDVDTTSLEGFHARTAQVEDIDQIVSIINESYSDLSVDFKQMLDYTKTAVYSHDLWMLVYDSKTGLPVGCGIADYDHEVKEGILEWIQVLPSYRGKKVGQFIVNQLLGRLAGKASFATVSGKVNSQTKPEKLYRRCGFSGDDIWHILSAK